MKKIGILAETDEAVNMVKVKKSDLVIAIDKVDREDEEKVGKVAASFGEIASLGIPIPKGFIISANAYHLVLKFNNLNAKTEEHLFTSDAKHILETFNIPKNLVREIFRAYKNLDSPLRDANVIVGCSFSKKKFTNVKGEANLVQKIRNFWSIYFDRKEIDFLDFEPAIFVYKTAPSVQSGIMFTIDPRYNDKTVVVIKDEIDNCYEVSKSEFKIVSKKINRENEQILSENQIISLAKWGKKLQDHYYFPQEVHFIFDEKSIFVTKTNPLTTIESKDFTEEKQQVANKDNEDLQNFKQNDVKNIRRIILKGRPIYPGIMTGHLRKIKKSHDINKLKSGDIAVVSNLKDLRHAQLKKKSRGLVIESKLHHLPFLRISPRTFGKPMIVTMPGSAMHLKDGAAVTIDGERGELYL